MITIDKLYEDMDDTLPISVIVPMSIKRKDFFYNMVYPLLEANKPAEIIVNDSIGTAPKKRNDGFDKSTQPLIFFCDDDILLPANHLKNLFDGLVTAMKENKNIGYAYSGYRGIVLHPETHPMKGNFQIPTVPFKPEALKNGNYISTMALIMRELFPRFDESLKRLQDWDLWLTLLLNHNIHGKEVFNNEFYAYYLDAGITNNNNSERDAVMTVLNKHKLI